jgi:hypothetical protein
MRTNRLNTQGLGTDSPEWRQPRSTARGGLVLRSCAHPPLVSVAVKTYPRYERDGASLQNAGQSWEFFDA